MTPTAFEALDISRWRRIEAVLDAALEMEPDDVPAYLAGACAGDAALRREVEALLDADRRASGFLAVPAAALLLPQAMADSRAQGEAAATEPPEPPPPPRLGRYAVLGELGRGGMGFVYAGRDERLGRAVAIKALPMSVAADPARLARFLAEAQLLGALHHPNVAAIHGVEQAGGRRYLILERVEGRTLGEHLREGALPPALALDVCAQVAEALAAAHAQGIVHRDLKPGNLMLTPTGLVKVLDFGLAKHVWQGEPRGGTTATHAPADGATRDGGAFGTPGYMSPEQILGGPQDARADLFAFGCVLYHCLAGSRPFAGMNAHAVLTATLNATPDFTSLPESTPAPVRGLLERALEKDASRRLSDAGEAAALLTEALAATDATPSRVRPSRGGPPRLPQSATPFVGREREIQAGVGLLARARLVTLTGGGGGGKTRLALEIARAATAFAGDDVWFADASRAFDAAGVEAVIATALDVREPSTPRLVGAIARHLGDRPGLLVLDHCEQALEACSTLVARLLEGTPGLSILATSREWLGVPGEQTFAVPPLSLPDPERKPTRASALESDAVRMFVSTAGLAPGGFRLTDDNSALVAGVCRGLDGVPLAIELAAALLRQQPLDSIAAELERRLGRDASPAEGPAGDPLQAAIRLSYERLADEEQRFFRALSAFTGGWTLESATAVCGPADDAFGTLDLLMRLVDQSLVSIQRLGRVEPRYCFLEPVRHFAAARRGAADETAPLEGRHLECFLALAERTAPSLLSGAEQARGIARLEADHPNLLAALDACGTAPGGAEKALRLAGSVWLFWYMRGHFTRGREALACALSLRGADTPGPARAQALFAAGGLAVFQGDYAEGRRLSEAALELFRALGDRLGIARALVHLALCESGDSRFPEARGRYLDAIPILRELGDARRLAAALNNLGVVERQQGDYRAAFGRHEEALELVRHAGDRDGTTMTLLNLALAAARLGRAQHAGRWVDEALAHAAELRARRAGTAALEVSAEVLAERGRWDEAARLVGAATALRAAMDLGSDPWWRRAQEELARRVRESLGDARFQALAADGADRGFEPAIGDARRWLAGVTDAAGAAAALDISKGRR